MARGATSLENGGFETHGVMDGLQAAFPEAEVPPWRTTDIDGQIEIWSSGFLGVPSHEGTAFAEVNVLWPAPSTRTS